MDDPRIEAYKSIIEFTDNLVKTTIDFTQAEKLEMLLDCIEAADYQVTAILDNLWDDATCPWEDAHPIPQSAYKDPDYNV